MRNRQNVSPGDQQEFEPPLHIKYRPTTLDDVIGQDSVTKSLKSLLAAKTRPHTFLFMGPSGTGKTTLARIMAKEFGCSPQNIIEVDAATNTGIDAMRELTDTLRYQGFGDNPNKMFILDECHALSKQAWQSILKSLEEPPPHVFFSLCTTDAGKVPDTIVTRCQSFTMKPVKYADIMDLLEDVCIAEKYDTPDEILKLVAGSCDGSPRMALTMLSKVSGCRDEDEAGILLEAPMESKEIIDLCRLLIDNKLEWKGVQKTISAIGDQSPESVRIVIVNYLSACLMRAKSEREVTRFLDLMSHFSKPCNPTDKWAPILLALGNIVFPV